MQSKGFHAAVCLAPRSRAEELAWGQTAMTIDDCWRSSGAAPDVVSRWYDLTASSAVRSGGVVVESCGMPALWSQESFRAYLSRVAGWQRSWPGARVACHAREQGRY